MKKKYIIIAILLFIPGFYFGYYVYGEYFEDKPVPTLKADLSPPKIRPEKGDDFADNSYNPIYDNIKSHKYNVASSKLTKLPEKPMKIASRPDKSDPISKIIEDDAKSQKTQPGGLKVISKSNGVGLKKKDNISSEKHYYVQVASHRSADLAEKEFSRITKKHSSIFKNPRHKIVRCQLKDKGVFFKLLIGPLAGPEQARLICKKLVQSRQSCIVKRM